MDLEAAEQLARQSLAQLPQRLVHVAAVASLAGDVSRALRSDGEALVVSAAWLHDIGYSSQASSTGFHPLDGARWLRERRADDDVVNLVAHHSWAVLEAEERGLDRELLEEFPRDDSLPHDALGFCDMTTGPHGQRMTVHQRLAEIRERYGPEDPVYRFVVRAEPVIVEAVRGMAAKLPPTLAQPM